MDLYGVIGVTGSPLRPVQRFFCWIRSLFGVSKKRVEATARVSKCWLAS
ncbi:hypothetical protein LC55x_5202 [Lysobacter capsici]|nr:hypothetical protein LC55x_5202 [Lysobacter capsici]